MRHGFKSTERFVQFEKPADLLSALYHIERGNSLFPRCVLQTKAGGYALPLSRVGDEQFAQLKTQYNWQANTVPSQPEGEEIELWQLLCGLWQYCDPPLRQIADDSVGNSLVHEPRKSAAIVSEYLLAVRNEQQAQEILGLLTNLLVEGIEAVPLFLESAEGIAESAPVYPFYWKVCLSRPSQTVLNAVEKAWWLAYKSSGQLRVQIFQEWPYQLRIPQEYWPRFDWGERTRLVLLNREPPHILLLRERPGRPVIRDLVEVAQLEPSGQASVVETSSLEMPLKLKVPLRFSRPTRINMRHSRLEELEKEIAIKQALVDRLRQQENFSRQHIQSFTEPLFIFTGDEHELPYELKLLLLEWSDQEAGLRALRYQRIAWHEALQKILPQPRGKAPVVHVLTTASALGEINALPGLGLELHEYAPGSGRRFDLLPEWAHYGLRLFIPREEQGILYPHIQPHKATAEKLSQALLPVPGKDWLAILVPSRQERVQALQIKASSPPFRPLFDAFQWDLDLPLESPVQLQPSEGLGKKLSEQVLATVINAFETEVMKQATIRRDSFVAQLKDHIAKIRREIEDVQFQASDHQKLFNEVNTLLIQIETNSAKLGKDVEDIRRENEWISDKLKEIDEITARWQETEAEISAIRETAEFAQGLRKRVKK